MSDAPAPLDIQPEKPSLLSRISLVWVVPFLALAVTLGVAWQSYANQGTEIEIFFDNASGIAADETEIRYRDVVVGKVSEVSFSDGLDVVSVKAKIDNNVAPYLDADAQFWVVRPDVSVRGISGLDTVLSGVYIEGSWNTDPQVQQYEFIGRDEPPLIRPGQRGTEITLRTTDGSALSTGAPILHKGIEVGYLETPRLSPDGQSVTVAAFIESPFDRRVTTNTRFWDASGFSVSFGTTGLLLNVNSIASLIEGGVAFDTVVSGGRPIRDGEVFDLFLDEDVARSSLFDDTTGPRLEVAVLFDGSVSGLTAGSDVTLQGLRIGEVASLSAVALEDVVEGPQVQLLTVLSIDPSRLGLGDEATPDDALVLLADFVRQRNLRARMVTGNILTGALNVDLVEVPDADEALLRLGARPYPLVPTTENLITDVADEAQSVLARVNRLPIEEIMQSAIDLMDSTNRLIRSDGVAAVPDEVAALLAEARALVGSADIQALPGELSVIMDDVDALVDSLNDAELADRIGGVIDNSDTLITSANALIVNIDAATQNLPAITAEVEALVAKANALEVEALLTEATATLDGVAALVASDAVTNVPATLDGLLSDGRALLASDDVLAIPADLRGVVGQIETILTGLTEADAADQLAAAITSANAAAASVEAASATLPAITEQLEQLARQSTELDLSGLVTAAEDTLSNINSLVAADTTQDLPGSVATSLEELTLFLQEVRQGGAVENVNAALASASQAAQAIEEAAASLPALSARASRLVEQTDAVVASFGERSRFSAETLSTLRDIQEAADAVSALARTIQRNPSSLLTGR